MFKHHLIKGSLAGGLVIAAAGFPSGAQAMVSGGGEASVPVAPPARVSSAAPRLDQLQRNTQAWFAVHGRFPVSVDSTAPTSIAPTATSSGGFQWDDAGIGAAGAVVLMSAGALGTGVARRRRVQRTVVG